ncbi:MAG: hypothetical protein KDH19_12220, partial [Geminicoccaceae bacterium]|nr:hypothetical protein [Geminicoccaceae bacterium]
MAKRTNELENHLRQWEARNRKRTALVTLAPVAAALGLSWYAHDRVTTVESGLDQALQTLEVPASQTGDGSIGAKLGAFSQVSEELGRLRALPGEMDQIRSALEQQIADLTAARDAAVAEAGVISETAGSSEAALAEALGEIERLGAEAEEIRTGSANELASLAAARDAAMNEAAALAGERDEALAEIERVTGEDGAQIAELQALVDAKESEKNAAIQLLGNALDEAGAKADALAAQAAAAEGAGGEAAARVEQLAEELALSETARGKAERQLMERGAELAATRNELTAARNEVGAKSDELVAMQSAMEAASSEGTSALGEAQTTIARMTDQLALAGS